MLLSDAQVLVQANGGFDSSVASSDAAQQNAWIEAAVREAVAAAKWLKQVRELGPTVVGTQDYDIDADVVEVRALRVGTSRPWLRVTLEELWTVESDASSYIAGAPGAYAPTFELQDAQEVDPNTLPGVRLWPAPSTSGLSIQGICAVQHPALSSDDTVIQVPDDLIVPIAVDGAIARGMLQVHDRVDLAAPYLGRFTDAKAELKSRANRRVGGGTRYVRVRGR